MTWTLFVFHSDYHAVYHFADKNTSEKAFYTYIADGSLQAVVWYGPEGFENAWRTT